MPNTHIAEASAQLTIVPRETHHVQRHSVWSERELKLARQACLEQANAITRMAESMGESFVQAVNLIHGAVGRVVVVGMGKSGHIGRKISATLASTGTPSFFVHPAEAFHGDLGMITPRDVVILISNSGETEEVVRLLPWLKHQGVSSIAITGKPGSTLGKNANIVLDVRVDKEACPHNLAPTTSTTCTLVMGDALAIALMSMSDFKPGDFAVFHPGGSLGKRLLTRVDDVMHKNVARNLPSDSVREVIASITKGRLGLSLVKEEGELLGIITDGDLRRAMSVHDNVLQMTARDIMTPSPQSVPSGTMFVDAEHLMHEKKINSLVVLDGKRVCGVVQIYDLH